MSEKFTSLPFLFHPGWTADDVAWEYEDQLPTVSNARFSEMYEVSEMRDGVRMYPFIVLRGEKSFFPLRPEHLFG